MTGRLRVVVISEHSSDGSPPGRALRLTSLRNWAEASGASVTELAVAGSDTRSGFLDRIVRVMRWRPPGDLASDAIVIVAGLASPHMWLLAYRLARRHPVIFDACDSWLLQAVAHRAAGTRKSAIPLVGLMVARLGFGGRILLAYISERDALADQGPSRRRGSVIVIPQSRRNELKALEPVRFPLERFVIALDADSFHNRRGLNEFIPALARWAVEAGVVIDLYGKADIPCRPEGIRFQGWAESILQVYEGSTGVFVTNTSGSGLANKILEADTAGRPLVMHESLHYMAEHITVPVWWFSSGEDVSTAAGACVRGETVEVEAPTAQSSQGRVVRAPSLEEIMATIAKVRT